MDPDFVVDFGEDEEEEEGEETRVVGGDDEFVEGDDPLDGVFSVRASGKRLPQYDGAADEESTGGGGGDGVAGSDAEVENFGVDENTNNNNEPTRVEIKIGGDTQVKVNVQHLVLLCSKNPTSFLLLHIYN